MAKENFAQQYRRQLDLEHWRKVLPGVPDEQIVLPHYNAVGLSFPQPPHGMDDIHVWDWISNWLYHVSYRHGRLGGGRDERMRRYVRNIERRAERWWDSLGKRTVLMLNQKLYTHRDGWKDIFDIYEFHACYSLCLAWLNLPLSQRSASAAKAKVRALLREMMERVEAGETNGDVAR